MPIFPPPFKKEKPFRPAPRVHGRFNFKARITVAKADSRYLTMANGQRVNREKKVHKTKKARVKARREARTE